MQRCPSIEQQKAFSEKRGQKLKGLFPRAPRPTFVLASGKALLKGNPCPPLCPWSAPPSLHATRSSVYIKSSRCCHIDWYILYVVALPFQTPNPMVGPIVGLLPPTGIVGWGCKAGSQSIGNIFYYFWFGSAPLQGVDAPGFKQNFAQSPKQTRPTFTPPSPTIQGPEVAAKSLGSKLSFPYKMQNVGHGFGRPLYTIGDHLAC